MTEVAPSPAVCVPRAPKEGTQPSNSAVPQPLINYAGQLLFSCTGCEPAEAAPQFILHPECFPSLCRSLKRCHPVQSQFPLSQYSKGTAGLLLPHQTALAPTFYSELFLPASRLGLRQNKVLLVQFANGQNESCKYISLCKGLVSEPGIQF